VNDESHADGQSLSSGRLAAFHKKCCEHGFIGMDASFIFDPETGAHPIVTVRFALEDWRSRDAFIKYFTHGG
jgi:hypothetical protein